jgi:hypothetical protein
MERIAKPSNRPPVSAVFGLFLVLLVLGSGVYILWFYFS